MGSLGASLPSRDSPTLALVVATPEQHIECRKINSASWKGPLTLPQYLDREIHICSQSLTIDGGLTCWVLVDTALPESERVVLSACETIKKKAWIAYGGKQVQETLTHGIGGVFSRPEFRGRGYATRMMTELAKALKTHQQPSGHECLFSVLWSDIGKAYYAKFGWQPFESSHVSIPPLSSPADYEPELQAHSLPDSLALDTAGIQATICSPATEAEDKRVLLSKSQSDPSTAFVGIAPDQDHMVWHFAREEFQHKTLHSFRPFPTIKGATATLDGVTATCVWTRVFGDTPATNVLTILRLQYNDPAPGDEEARAALIRCIASILQRARLVAQEWDMRKVDLWSPTALTMEASKLLFADAEVVHREKSSVACLRWDGEKREYGSKVEWLWNEKFAWC